MLLALGVALCALGGCRGARADESPPALMELSDGWQYRWGDAPRDAAGHFAWLDDPDLSPAWENLRFPDYPPGREGRQHLWLRVRLPDEIAYADPVVKTSMILTRVEFYLDHQRLHRYGELGADASTGVEPAKWHLVALPSDAGGKMLYLRVASRYTQIGTQGRVLVGSRADVLKSVLHRDIVRVVAAGVILLLSIIAFAIGLAGRERKLALSLALYGTCTGAYSLFYTELKDLFIDAPIFWIIVWANATLFVTVGLLMFLEELFGAGRWSILRRLWQAHLAIACATWLYTVTFGQLSPFSPGSGAVEYVLFALARLLMLIGVPVMLWILINHGRRGDRDARIFLVGLVPVALVTVRELLAYAGLIAHEYDSPVHWSVLALVVALGVIVQRRHADRLHKYSLELRRRELEKSFLLKDLHDGIGGITTNIGMLAEIGKNDLSPETAHRTLSTISDLSRAGISEIRGFLQSVEEAGATWPALAAEMRRYGAQLVESHSGQFSMNVMLASAPEQPGSVLSMHVLRTYREALTNALKHGGGSGVHVELEVTLCRLVLAVRNPLLDEPPGRAPPAGVGLSKGLANMKARAESLGGRLDVSLEGEAVVRLEIPLPMANQMIRTT